MSKIRFWDMTRNDWEKFCVEQNIAAFFIKQIFQWAYKKKVFNPDEWTNVSKKNREMLKDQFDFTLPKIVWNAKSVDGTRKFLVALEDQSTVECVLIPAKDRLTLCLSSQVGCAIGCTFCHTGTQGLTRNLKSGEIVGQYIVLDKFMSENEPSFKNISNIVYMGQGEPLHNFRNTMKSLQVFLDVDGLGLGHRKITVSTSGLVPQIEKLDQFPPVNFAISLHATHDDIRSELMPINQRYDLETLFAAIKKIPLRAHRRITYEYILIDQFNDRREDVHGLVRLLDSKKSKVNIIPFNEYPESEFKRPSDEKIQWFNSELNSRGLTSTVRATKGHDILAACGQLKSELEKENTWEVPTPQSSDHLQENTARP